MSAYQCPGCEAKDKLTAETNPPDDIEVSESLYEQRLETCMSCPFLLYANTCKFSGYIVYYQAALKDRACSDPAEKRW